MPDPLATSHLDSLELMYRAFQRCRHSGPDARPTLVRLLRRLHAVLATVRQCNAFVVGVEPAALSEIPGPIGQEVIVCLEATSAPGAGLSPGQREVLDLVQTLVVELVRLVESGNTPAVRGLGHAFHNLPSSLRAEQPYDRGGKLGWLQIAAGYWDDLSSEMHDAFCRFAGVDLPTVERLMRREGFAIRYD